MFSDVPFLLAFTGGLVATVNPCGFAMLPAYLSFFLGLSGDDPATPRPVGPGRALGVGAMVAAGFLVVFGAAWVLFTAGIRTVVTAVPWAALVVGALVLVLGAWMLSGRPLPIRLPAPGRAPSGRSAGSVFLFGAAFAVASLSCTLPVFLAVVAGTATRLGFVPGFAVFGVYALGMALPLLAITTALAFGRDSLLRRARNVGSIVNRVGGGLLVAAGGYILLYWGTDLAGVTGGPFDSAIHTVENASSRLTTIMGDRPVLWGSMFGAVVVLAVAVSVLCRLSSHRKEQTP